MKPIARRRARDWLLAVPLTIFSIVFFVTPLLLLAVVSFYESADMKAMSFAQYHKFLGDAFNLSVLGSTLLLGLKATLVCLLFGYPLAWVCVNAAPKWQPVLVFLVILPLLTSVIVRTFAWIVILGNQGIVNKTLLAAGFIDEPLKLLFSETGLVMVLSQVHLPLIVLPLLATMSKIDPNLRDASAALGAGAWRTFRRVILPLSVPGILAGCILVYASCVTAFVTQTLIGGARLIYMPLAIYQQAVGAKHWPLAAAMSLAFLVSVLFIVYLLNLVGRANRGYIHG